MSDYFGVAWTEGMFLRPQHFQQANRHINHVIRQVCENNLAYAWGCADINIDMPLLSTGKFAVNNLTAIMPDLCPIEIPAAVELPAPLAINKDVCGELIYFAIPALKSNGINLSAIEDNAITRYKLDDLNVSDDNLGSQFQETIQIAKVHGRLMLSSDDTSGFMLLPLARVIEVSSDGVIKLDSKYIPPSLNTKSNKPLTGIIREIGALINQRAESISGRLCQGYAGTTSVADFILLQTLNKYSAIFDTELNSEQLHPYKLYTRLIELSGELATFSSANKRVPKLPVYDHSNLQGVFEDTVNFLYQSLSQVVEQTATEIKLEQSKFGISVGALNDKSLLSNAQFVLAIKANVPHEELRKILPSQIKIGGVETIRDLVNNQIPGITISNLPSAPREVPYHSGFHYFELNKNSEHWNQLHSSGGIAMHLSGNYPELQLTLWAIRT